MRFIFLIIPHSAGTSERWLCARSPLWMCVLLGLFSGRFCLVRVRQLTWLDQSADSGMVGFCCEVCIMFIRGCVFGYVVSAVNAQTLVCAQWWLMLCQRWSVMTCGYVFSRDVSVHYLHVQHWNLASVPDVPTWCTPYTLHSCPANPNRLYISRLKLKELVASSISQSAEHQSTTFFLKNQLFIKHKAETR